MIYEKQKTKNISFPLGGIGSGSIGLRGNGELKDFEIFNRPAKNSENGYTHFAIKASFGNKKVAKILHGDTNESFMGTSSSSNGYLGFGCGPSEYSLAGFPHFKNFSFNGEFPLANITFSDDEFPAIVRLRAFNPFIPHDEFNSSIPAAFFEWEIENITNETVNFALACTVRNPSESSLNETVCDEKVKGVMLRCASLNESENGYSDLCILTDNEDTAVQEYWYRGGWMDDCTTYWKNFCSLDRMPKRSYSEPAKKDHGSVVSYVSVAPREKAKLRFVISWNVPIAYNYWDPRKEDGEATTWKNYYATQFKNSFSSAKYSIENFDHLLDKTELFSTTLQKSTLPTAVKDAISANLSVIKTPTALRLEDGSFWGWEGCFENIGSCFGTCQHVWNYAYAMPYLFPRLERTMRENMLNYALQSNGATSFRINLPLKREMATLRACVDGQMGEVIKCYREWKFSGDDEWLRKHSEGIFKMLEYAWSESNPDKWDADMDGVLEGRQHHTLDMELFGPSSWLQGLYLLALYCGAKMARHLGNEEKAKLYESLYKSGRAWTNENLFNGKYFFHKIDLKDKGLIDRFGAYEYWNEEAGEIKNQVADGCIIDQLLADWHAILIGADSVFDSDKKKIALKNLYKNNYKSSMRKFTNVWRIFALNDESGTVICSYPNESTAPAIPIRYWSETMTGFEYALAGLMISEGLVRDGERIVKAVRDRYNGENRNPWNEIECGGNYARSMASYALLPIYSGFSFDMTKKRIGFSPLIEKGNYLFSACDSWGAVEFDKTSYRISIFGNPLSLRAISIPDYEKITKVRIDGKEVDFEISDGKISFKEAEIHRELVLK